MHAPAKSQINSDGESTVRGIVEARFTQGLTVELYDAAKHHTVSYDINADGAFEFRGATPGASYLVRVINAHGEAVYQGNVIAGVLGAAPLIIDVARNDPAAAAGDTVSVTELRCPPSRAAVSAAARAQRLSSRGDHARAAESLEKAVAASPDYAEAHTNLAAQYLHLGRYAEAITECQRAIDLKPSNTPALTNLAFAYMHLGNSEAALSSARAAVHIESGNAQAHFVIGLVMFINHGPVDEVRHELELAAPTLPAARRTLDWIKTGKLVSTR
jgi:tetratricopeptide (TPR) repeat protein